MCRVNVTTTLEEHSIYVEEDNHPDSLLHAVEGEDPGPVARQAWTYMRRHPESPTCALSWHLQPALPPWRLNQVARAISWLMREIIQQRGAK